MTRYKVFSRVYDTRSKTPLTEEKEEMVDTEEERFFRQAKDRFDVKRFYEASRHSSDMGNGEIIVVSKVEQIT